MFEADGNPMHEAKAPPPLTKLLSVELVLNFFRDRISRPLVGAATSQSASSFFHEHALQSNAPELPLSSCWRRCGSAHADLAGSSAKPNRVLCQGACGDAHEGAQD